MIGLRDLCAALLGAGVGLGTPVVVKEVQSAPKVERTAPKKVTRRSKPPTTATTAPPSVISDCPTSFLTTGPIIDMVPIGDLTPFIIGSTPYSTNVIPVPGGFIKGPPPSLVVPGIPEPGTWIMMLGGFGLVGLAVRKRKTK